MAILGSIKKHLVKDDLFLRVPWFYVGVISCLLLIAIGRTSSTSDSAAAQLLIVAVAVLLFGLALWVCSWAFRRKPLKAPWLDGLQGSSEPVFFLVLLAFMMLVAAVSLPSFIGLRLLGVRGMSSEAPAANEADFGG